MGTIKLLQSLGVRGSYLPLFLGMSTFAKLPLELIDDLFRADVFILRVKTFERTVPSAADASRN